ncbi:MAG: CPBP family intramembrane metalloprotease [Anaerolineales bacterium]|nr:CPBP family intramembrane metalloprotease [Anaerolineales bacterium]MCA9931331.1 CPBP family intramembrane metalloprotease [Anaerolineales bacterium]
MTIGGVEFDLKLTFLIILGTVVPMLDYYGHNITSVKAYDRFIWYFVIPMLVIVLLFREPPADFGFKLGNWRIGLMWTAVACVGMAIILIFIARTPAMQQYYDARAPRELRQLIFRNGVELFAWEFIWRGLMLFAFARAFGPGPAIFLQAVPFAFMHLGKPEVETLSTIFGGAAFGFVAWQSESFIYPWLIHWFITSFTMLIASGRI